MLPEHFWKRWPFPGHGSEHLCSHVSQPRITFCTVLKAQKGKEKKGRKKKKCVGGIGERNPDQTARLFRQNKERKQGEKK